MALGAEHIQSAKFHDLVVLHLDGGLGLLEHLGPGFLVFLRVLHRIEATLVHHVNRDVLGIAAEHDVGTSACHVRGNRDGVLAARHRHDGCFAIMLLGVEHLVRNARLLQQIGQVLGILHRRRTHKHGLAGTVALLDVLHYRPELAVRGRVHEVGFVHALHGLIGIDRHDADIVR